MSNIDTILHFIAAQSPRRVTNADISSGTGIRPHQQVFQLTKKLLEAGSVRGLQIGDEWHFWVDAGRLANEPSRQDGRPPDLPLPDPGKTSALTSAQFEALAAEAMGRHLGVTLRPGQVEGLNKRFDFVSPDKKIVGDAKYFTMVQGERLPPAKFSVIAEYVWLLEHADASRKFLVFGNDRRVPEQWLQRYGYLVSDIEFFFLTNDGTLQPLKASSVEK